MKHLTKTFLVIATLLLFIGCQNREKNKLFRQMKAMAVTYLQQEEIKDYKDLTVTSVDTVTEYGYAKLTSELLGGMEEVYEQMFWEAGGDTAKQALIGISLREIQRTRLDLDDLVDNGDLLTKGVLLYMVTGNYQKNGENQEFMFLVEPDKKTLHTLDPFGNNLLYKEE